MKKLGIVFSISLLIATNYCIASEEAKSLVSNAERIVLNGLRSSDDGIRANSIEVASYSSNLKLIEKATDLLTDPSPMVSFAAAIAIGDTQYLKSEPKLIQMAKSEDLNVAIAASYALCKLGKTEYLKKIEEATNAMDPTVVANAAMLLGKLKNKASLPLLYKLKDDPASSDIVAFNAVEAIARIGDAKIYAKIWTMLLSVYADDRYMGACAMGTFGGSRGANALITLLDDDVPEVRLAAAEQLGKLGDASGQVVVLEYLNNPPKDEKTAVEKRNVLAALAIGQIGGEPLTAFLPKLLKSDMPQVQLAAAKSIFILAKGQ